MIKTKITNYCEELLEEAKPGELEKVEGIIRKVSERFYFLEEHGEERGFSKESMLAILDHENHYIEGLPEEIKEETTKLFKEFVKVAFN